MTTLAPLATRLRPVWARLLACAALLVLALAGGCATPVHQGVLNAALFAREPPAPEATATRLPGRVALVMTPAVRATTYTRPTQPAIAAQVPIGAIVGEALQLALADRLQDGAASLDAPPATGTGWAATLVVETLTLAHDDQLAWVLPAPPPLFIISQRDYLTHLAFQLRLLDGQGRTVWTRSYDSGPVPWKRSSFWSTEAVPVGLVRVAHETAWRLARQAAGDLSEWLADERNRAREL